MNRWGLASTNFTPDKTEIKTTNNSISIKSKGCKGKVKYREQCENCLRKGSYQAGIFAFLSCCNRDDGWRKLEGETDKKCNYYLENKK